MGHDFIDTVRKYMRGDKSVARHKNKGRPWSGRQKYVKAEDALRDAIRAFAEAFRDHEDQDGFITLPCLKCKFFRRGCESGDGILR